VYGLVHSPPSRNSDIQKTPSIQILQHFHLQKNLVMDGDCIAAEFTFDNCNTGTRRENIMYDTIQLSRRRKKASE